MTDERKGVVLIKGDRANLSEYDDTTEWQTDKQTVKIVGCNGCGKPIAVNAFYAPALAKCAACGHQSKSAGTGQAAIVQAGRTDPAKARNLADALINQQFGQAICPLCTEEMELKHIAHNSRYGPSRVVGYEKGQPLYDNDTGETVLLQCNKCKTVTSHSTTSQIVYRRQNEPKAADTAPASEYLLGARS